LLHQTLSMGNALLLETVATITAEAALPG